MCLCVTVCVLSERNLCYLLLTRFIMEHWNQNPSRPGQMACSACLQWLHPSAHDTVLTRGKNAIDPDSPKNNQINSFSSLSALPLWLSFEVFSWKTQGKSALIFWKTVLILLSSATHVIASVTEKPAPQWVCCKMLGPLCVGNSSSYTNTMEYYLLIEAMLYSGETQSRVHFQSNESDIVHIFCSLHWAHTETLKQKHIHMPNSHTFTKCY